MFRPFCGTDKEFGQWTLPGISLWLPGRVQGGDAEDNGLLLPPPASGAAINELEQTDELFFTDGARAALPGHLGGFGTRLRQPEAPARFREGPLPLSWPGLKGAPELAAFRYLLMRAAQPRAVASVGAHGTIPKRERLSP